MDCDTTGIEPDFALVKFKKLAGGGYFKIANQSIRPALKNLGYSPEQIEDILRYVMRTLSLEGAPHINRETLLEKGFTEEDLEKVEKDLPTVCQYTFVVNVWILWEDCLNGLDFKPGESRAPGLNFLKEQGFNQRESDEASDVICRMMNSEGAPHLKE